jgi:hypothetical protein
MSQWGRARGPTCHIADVRDWQLLVQEPSLAASNCCEIAAIADRLFQSDCSFARQ